MSETKGAEKNILIEGCINDNAREVISQMLTRRLAELDAGGQKAQFVMKLQNEVNEMPSCKELFNSDTENVE